MVQIHGHDTRANGRLGLAVGSRSAGIAQCPGTLATLDSDGRAFRDGVSLTEGRWNVRPVSNPSELERDTCGNIIGWFGVNTDISDQVKAEQSREVLARELSHRIKNIFSVVVGLISVSAKIFPEAKMFARDLSKRIVALGSAHECIRPRDDTDASASATSLFELANYLLAPYQEADRIIALGDDVPVGEKADLSLAVRQTVGSTRVIAGRA